MELLQIKPQTKFWLLSLKRFKIYFQFTALIRILILYKKLIDKYLFFSLPLLLCLLLSVYAYGVLELNGSPTSPKCYTAFKAKNIAYFLQETFPAKQNFVELNSNH